MIDPLKNVGDSDEFAALAGALVGTLSLKTRFHFVANQEGTYDTVRSEVLDKKSGQWVPLTPDNINDVLGGGYDGNLT